MEVRPTGYRAGRWYPLCKARGTGPQALFRWAGPKHRIVITIRASSQTTGGCPGSRNSTTASCTTSTRIQTNWSTSIETRGDVPSVTTCDWSCIVSTRGAKNLHRLRSLLHRWCSALIKGSVLSPWVMANEFVSTPVWRVRLGYLHAGPHWCFATDMTARGNRIVTVGSGRTQVT